MDVLTISRRLGHGSPTSHSGSMATCLATVMTRRPIRSSGPLARCSPRTRPRTAPEQS